MAEVSHRDVFDKGPDFVRKPVLQCVQIKAMENKKGDGDRFRLVLSDIDNFIQTMLSSRTTNFAGIASAVLTRSQINRTLSSITFLRRDRLFDFYNITPRL